MVSGQQQRIRRGLVTVLIVFLGTILLYAQETAERQSLWKIYRHQQSHTGRISALADLAYAYHRTDPDSALLLARQALSRAKKIGFARGKAKAWIAAGAALIQQAQYTQADDYLQQAVDILEGLDEPSELAKCLSELGLSAYQQNNMTTARQLLQRAKTLAVVAGDHLQEAICWHRLGMIRSWHANYKTALDAYHHSVTIRETHQLPLSATTLTNIGNIYHHLGQYEMSLSYYRQALPLLLADGNRVAHLITCYNIGTVFEAKESYEDALRVYTEVLQKGRELGTRRVNAIILEAIGNIHAAQEQYELAESYYQQSLALQDSIGNPLPVSILLSLTELYLQTDQLDRAEEIAKNALELAVEQGAKKEQKEANQLIAQILEQRGAFAQALDYTKTGKQLQDSIFTSELADRLVELQTQYDLSMAKKAHEIEQLSLEKEQEKIQKQQQRRLLSVLVVSLVIISCLLLVLWWMYLQRKSFIVQLEEQNQQLNESNRHLGEANDKLKASNQELAVANSKLKNFAFAASHDLKESVRSITSFSQLLNRRLDGNRSDIKLYLEYITQGGRHMKKVLDDLLSYSNLQVSQSSFEQFDAREAIVAALEAHQDSLVKAQARLQLSEELPMLCGDRPMIERVFHHVIENALKYRRPAETLHIEIGVRLQQNEAALYVKDNGIGMEPRYLDHIFEPFYRLNGRLLSGSGLGLAICHKIITLHDGSIWAESAPGQGTTIFMRLPIAELTNLQ